MSGANSRTRHTDVSWSGQSETCTGKVFAMYINKLRFYNLRLQTSTNAVQGHMSVTPIVTASILMAVTNAFAMHVTRGMEILVK